MNLIFQDAQDAAGMHSECSGCELILFADVIILIRSLLRRVIISVKHGGHFDIYIPYCRVRGLQVSNILTKYLLTILNISSWCEHCLTLNIIALPLTSRLESS